MPLRSKSDPKYRHYKPKNLAVVRLDGRDHYLGRHDSPESWQAYYQLLAEWRTTGLASRHAPAINPPSQQPLSVNELLLGYWRHAQGYYRDQGGAPSRELDNVRDALKPLRRLYGLTPAADFGALALRSVREEMVRSGLARSTVNARVHRIRRAFRWGVSRERIPESVLGRLRSVESLTAGRSEAREPEAIEPVSVEHVESTIPLLVQPVAAMVRVQHLTGCRVGEVVTMRGCDLKTDGPNWEYRPAGHKNAWRGQDRVIPLGRKAREVIRGFLSETYSHHFQSLFFGRFASRRAVEMWWFRRPLFFLGCGSFGPRFFFGYLASLTR